MNKIDNPFTPGAGFLPPELAGREQVIEDGRVVAARTRLLRAERGLMLIGSRGVGKTSLLKWLAEDARQSGVIPVIVEIQNDSQGIEELSAKMREALHTLDYVSKVKSGVRESFAVLGNFIRKFAVNVGSLGVYRAKFAPPFAVRTSLADPHEADGLWDIPLCALGPICNRLFLSHR